jgi:hypothetical protein
MMSCERANALRRLTLDRNRVQPAPYFPETLFMRGLVLAFLSFDLPGFAAAAERARSVKTKAKTTTRKTV